MERSSLICKIFRKESDKIKLSIARGKEGEEGVQERPKMYGTIY